MAEGFRYRKKYKQLPGKPNIVFTKYKIAVFCDSEFFHGKDFVDLKKWRSPVIRTSGLLK